MKTLVIVGNDRIANSVLKKIKNSDQLLIVIDKSTNIKRVFKLINNNVISLAVILKMVICEVLRGSKNKNAFESIRSNSDLIDVINNFKPDRIVLYRAGLIINKTVLDTGIQIHNIHAAKVPEFGGLGSIFNALDKKVYNQFASLHVVTTSIDKGEILDFENYTLDPNLSYCKNESIAYLAAEKLLLRTIGF